jgi:hypothetical protein
MIYHRQSGAIEKRRKKGAAACGIAGPKRIQGPCGVLFLWECPGEPLSHADLMKRLFAAILLLVMVFTMPGLRAGHTVLLTMYQPLDGLADNRVEVSAVPFAFSGATPEGLYTSITLPHIPQQNNGEYKTGDINVASRAGIFLGCHGNAEALILTFDFTRAVPEHLNKRVIEKLLACIEKTRGESKSGPTLRSRMAGAEKYGEFVKLIEAKIPPEKAGAEKAEKKAEKKKR